MDSSGFPVISYYDDTNSLKLVVCNDVNCAGGDESIAVVDTAGDVGRFTSLELDDSGFPVISYNDYGNDDLKLAVCNNATCTQPTITIVDSAGEVGRFTSLALTSDNYPIISYFDDTNDDLKIAVCNDIACTTPTLVTVDSEGVVGQYTSMELNSSGYPAISYYRGTPNNDLKIAVYELSKGETVFEDGFE